MKPEQMKYISIFSALFLLAMFFFTWGFVSAEYEKFPWAFIDPVQNEIAEVLEGGKAREGALKRLKHNAGIRPEKMVEKFEPEKTRNYRTVDMEGLKKRRQSEPLPEEYADAFYGNILITSSGQGRVMVVTPGGETVFEFINRYSSEEVLLVSEAVWVPHDFSDFDSAHVYVGAGLGAGTLESS